MDGNDLAKVSVADNGVSIPAESRKVSRGIHDAQGWSRLRTAQRGHKPKAVPDGGP